MNKPFLLILGLSILTSCTPPGPDVRLRVVNTTKSGAGATLCVSGVQAKFTSSNGKAYESPVLKPGEEWRPLVTGYDDQHAFVSGAVTVEATCLAAGGVTGRSLRIFTSTVNRLVTTVFATDSTALTEVYMLAAPAPFIEIDDSIK